MNSRWRCEGYGGQLDLYSKYPKQIRLSADRRTSVLMLHATLQCSSVGGRRLVPSLIAGLEHTWLATKIRVCQNVDKSINFVTYLVGFQKEVHLSVILKLVRFW